MAVTLSEDDHILLKKKSIKTQAHKGY